jgi:thiol:disulfide interchange protein
MRCIISRSVGLVRGLFASFTLAAAAIISCTSGVDAQARFEDSRHVTASLVAETQKIVPGEPLRLALRQRIDPGWHTYWSNPGESGTATTIDWKLPDSFKAGPISWPAPVRFSYGPVVGYGYEREVLLPVTIDVPATLPSGGTVTFVAHTSWLACSETCIPEDAELSISLLVGTAPEADPRWVDAFASTLARIPVSNPFRTTVESVGDQFILRVATGDATRLRHVSFFPLDQGVIDDAARQLTVTSAEGLSLTLQRDKSSKPLPGILNGVLVFKDTAIEADGTTGAFVISAPIDSSAPAGFTGLGVVVALLLAFAGGIVLNLMPCVLPVLSIKVLALVQDAHAAPGEARAQGVAYTAGVLASFAIVAITLLALRAAGAEIGWGFQLQSPLFVTVLIYVLFAVGLNLSGAFSLGFALAGIGSNVASRRGYAGSFLTGALATVVATPCTAPFMASAIGFAITQPWYVSLAVFEVLGLGLAFPFLLVALYPGMRRFLTKPGIWMLRLKQFLAFPVYGTAVWLMFVLSHEAGEWVVGATLAGLVLIAFAAWLYDAAWSSQGRLRSFGIGLSAAAALGAFVLPYLMDLRAGQLGASQAGEKSGLWQPFSRARLDELRAAGMPVFVDFTAAWCITCKVNERIALSDPDVRKAFSDAGVAMLRADWTRQDSDITHEIEANGRAGVPLYLFYPRPTMIGETPPPIILPQVLTAGSILREVLGH